VLDLGSGLAGSIPGMILADNGADVVKVEPPWGARERGTRGHQMWNRGKRSVVIDLSTDSGRTRLVDLAARADVLISNFGPGSADRLRIAPDVLPAANPALVACVIDGFGPLGSLFPLPGFDGLVSALTGRMAEVDLLSGGGAGPAPGRSSPPRPYLPTAPPS
jgi:crotonobetainyl-CoA:carnitine CoA-transferase CaiB-like acyl-CoA transferase